MPPGSDAPRTAAIAGRCYPVAAAARRRPLALVAIAGALAHLRVLVPALRHPRPPIVTDAALFEHAGWYLARGGRLYLDVWEPKPPLPYETTALAALVAGGSVYRLHLLSVALTVAAGVGTMLLVASLAGRLTGRPDAALVAGLSPLLLPGYFYLPAFGFNPKPFVTLAGLLSVRLALDRRPFAAGAAAAASVGYWQPAIVFPALAVGLAAQRGSRRDVVRTCLGGAVSSAALLAPVVYWGAVPAMLAETVVIPLAVPEPVSPVPHVSLVGGRDLKYGLVAVGVAGAAILLAARRPHREDWWWVVAGAAWFGFVGLAVDYDYYPDAIPGLAFVALGIAFLYAERPRLRPVVAGAVVLLASVSVLSLGGFGVVVDPLPVPEPRPLSSITPYPIPGDGAVQDVKVLFWRERIPSTCHYRMSGLERRWLSAAGYEPRCGRLADALDRL